MSEKISKEFWIGQVAVIIATVLGVYLAATVGFKKAVELELVKSDRDTYYLMHSFVDEVENNIAEIEGFVKEYHNQPYRGAEDNPSLSLYVFDTMKFAGSTFEIKAQQLNGVANYYKQVEDLLARGGARKLGKTFMLKELVEANENAREAYLKPLKETVKQLKDKLKNDNDIDV